MNEPKNEKCLAQSGNELFVQCCVICRGSEETEEKVRREMPRI